MASFPEFVRFKHRPHARCPRCSTLERGRGSWLYLLRRTDLLTSEVRMLHVAPEASLRVRIEHRLNVDYVPTEFEPDRPDEGVDLQSMPFGDESFDLIFCSHVLEHVPDDHKAMREMFRVLRAGGLAVILVPTRNHPHTYEDETITTPEGRTKAFGRFDHLRWYGKDVVERLRGAGFEVTVEYFTDLLPIEERNRFGLVTEPIFACRKPAASTH
jgi:SAM-dependent methyltransferase